MLLVKPGWIFQLQQALGSKQPLKAEEYLSVLRAESSVVVDWKLSNMAAGFMCRAVSGPAKVVA